MLPVRPAFTSAPPLGAMTFSASRKTQSPLPTPGLATQPPSLGRKEYIIMIWPPTGPNQSSVHQKAFSGCTVHTSLPSLGSWHTSPYPLAGLLPLCTVLSDESLPKQHMSSVQRMSLPLSSLPSLPSAGLGRALTLQSLIEGWSLLGELRVYLSCPQLDLNIILENRCFLPS